MESKGIPQGLLSERGQGFDLVTKNITCLEVFSAVDPEGVDTSSKQLAAQSHRQHSDPGHTGPDPRI